jgi:type IV pilus assembly protein PilY1
MILLDSSGSMERMIDGTIPGLNAANRCNCSDNGPNNPLTCTWPTAANPSPNPNRWNTVQQSLTGYLQAPAGDQGGFNCVAMSRATGGTFTTEYQIGGNIPYDHDYQESFHRMVAHDTSAGVGCVVAPGPIPGGSSSSNGVGPSPTLFAGGNATDFTHGTSTVLRPFGGPFNVPPTPCQFNQLNNGIIPTMSSLMRFGLMTFDTEPLAGTGVTAANAVATPAFDGLWSYFPGWSAGTGTACDFSAFITGTGPNCTAEPVNCASPQPYAVGARNPGAPPWEGRMVPFPTPAGLTQAATNQEVADVILASRPYGGTPIAGMFTAAQYYFTADPTGPQSDPFVKSASGLPCRPEFIILITDGAPNMDMRPACSNSVTGDSGGTPGTCPFDLPENIAAKLYNNGMASVGQQFVTTYVIGFAVSSFNDGTTPVQCQNLVTGGGLVAACNPPVGSPPGSPPANPLYAPCCELENIAFNGGSGHAYFADTPGDLQAALGSIMAAIGSGATTRTVPSFSPSLTSAGNAQMYNAQLIPHNGAPWAGNILRTTYVCDQAHGGATTTQLPTVTNGDDFANNLNLTASITSRYYIAMEPTPLVGFSAHDASASIRPFAPTTASAYDGLLFEKATVLTATNGGANVTANITSNLTDDALGITPGANSYVYSPVNGTGTKYLTDTQTANVVMNFVLGQDKPSGLPADFAWVPRCPTSAGCQASNSLAPPAAGTVSAFGDIYHATPTVVGAPGSLLDDAQYSGFRTFITTTTGGGDAGPSGTTSRRPVVFAPTNDGILHAFWADQTTSAPNEAWSMLMPAAMPNLLASYPATDQMLLDGAPVVKDTVWDRSTVNGSLCGSGSTTCPWHTTLVAGYGASHPGYYAVDVTNPVPTASNPPTFRWQLTKLPASNFQIFGGASATPAITTVALSDGGSPPTIHEVGVAILPGGVDPSGPTSGPGGIPCDRIRQHVGSPTDAEPAGSLFPARTAVRCWGTPATGANNYQSPVHGRSLSIVRLDTGEIIRVFARASGGLTGNGDFNATDPLITSHAVTDTLLDSPMTGMPVVYPTQVGAVASRIFAGDADGTIWRFDVSNPDPTQWKGEIFLDLYNTTVDTSSTSWADGQPFDVPFVTSFDTTGNIVLNVASGTTQTYDTNGTQYVYSITEKVGGSPVKLRSFVNWYWGPRTPSVLTTPSFLQAGERVSGPMTVFNSTLFFATYYAGNATTGCNSGRAKIWGFDFTAPQDPTDLSKGGNRILTTNAFQDWVDPGVSPGNPQTAVVPGVAILATPACAQVSTNTVAGITQTTFSNAAAGSFSLVFNIGAKPGAGATQGSIAQNPPVAMAQVSSWASVLE